jgi:hypothetical protein
MILIKVQSDIFCQIKPSKLSALEEKLKTASGFSPYNFPPPSHRPPSNVRLQNEPTNTEVWAVYRLNFTHRQVYEMLKKAVGIVENTEEYILYLFTQSFGNKTDKNYSIPPGTVRIYSQDLICFFNGKTWKKLKL